MINSNLGPLSYRFRDTTTYSLKFSLVNCGQTAADRDMVTIWQPIRSRRRPIQWYHRRPPTTYCLATIHLRQTRTDRQTDDNRTKSSTVT